MHLDFDGDDRLARKSDIDALLIEVRYLLLKILAGERRIIMDQDALDKEIATDLAPALSGLKTFVLGLEAKLAAASPTQPISTLDLSKEIAQLHAFADAANALDAVSSDTPTPAPSTTTEPDPAPAASTTTTTDEQPAPSTEAPASTDTAASEAPAPASDAAAPPAS